MEGRILIIDDEESILDVLTECFTEENFEVKTLLAVNDVIGVVKEFAPDVVIVDYLLRGLNGGELCHEIKMSNPSVPVVIISAFPKHTLSLARYDCDLFIAKPFDIFDLVEQVKLLKNNSKLGSYENSLHKLKLK
jgi:DNA-binding response OmpR family regulator